MKRTSDEISGDVRLIMGAIKLTEGPNAGDYQRPDELIVPDYDVEQLCWFHPGRYPTGGRALLRIGPLVGMFVICRYCYEAWPAHYLSKKQFTEVIRRAIANGYVRKVEPKPASKRPDDIDVVLRFLPDSASALDIDSVLAENNAVRLSIPDLAD